MTQFKINMLLPIDEDGIIVVPICMFSWIKRVRRIREVIDLGDLVSIEQWDDAIYFQTTSIYGQKQEFLRYNVTENKLQYWNNGDNIVVNTKEELEMYYNEHFNKYNLKNGFRIEKI